MFRVIELREGRQPSGRPLASTVAGLYSGVLLPIDNRSTSMFNVSFPLAGYQFRIVLLAALAVGMGLTMPAVGASPKPGSKLPPDQLREVNRLLSEFRRAGGDMRKKQDICKQVCDVGPAAVPLMAAAIEKELRPQLRRYTGGVAAASGRGGEEADCQSRSQRSGQFAHDGARPAASRGRFYEGGHRWRRRSGHETPGGDMRNRAGRDSGAVPRIAGRSREAPGLGKLWESCQSQMPKTPAPDGQETPKAASFEEYLLGEEEVAAALAMPMDAKTRSVLAINAKLAEKIDPEEARTILACNLMRNLLGLSALMIDLNCATPAATTPRTWRR